MLVEEGSSYDFIDVGMTCVKGTKEDLAVTLGYIYVLRSVTNVTTSGAAAKDSRFTIWLRGDVWFREIKNGKRIENFVPQFRIDVL